MTDRRRKIAALRAKADSTTFPAEAEALRAKADDLEALEPTRPPIQRLVDAGWTVIDDQTRKVRVDDFDWIKERLDANRRAEEHRRATEASAKRTADWTTFPWGQAYTPPPWARGGAKEGWMTVTDVNGQTHRERIY